MSPAGGSTVAVLLATRNGERFLREQLDSIAAQSHPDWVVHVSDDASSDATLDIVADFRREVGARRVLVHSGPCRGFVANYLSLACRDGLAADYLSFCDQDDIWESDRLARALHWLQGVPAEVPALHCGRTQLVDAQGRPLGLSAPCPKPPSFANALVQSLAGANTMVFNAAALELLRRAGPDVAVASHDWWLYLLVTGAGGQVRYDPLPSVRYRQHDANAHGTNRGLAARLNRFCGLLGGRMRAWNDVHCSALHELRERLTPANRILLEEFDRMRARRGVDAIRRFRACGIHRQTRIDDFALALAALLGRL